MWTASKIRDELRSRWGYDPSPKDAEEHHHLLPLKTEAELGIYLATTFGILIPDKVIREGHSSPWRALCDSFFARHRVTVWLASRSFGGKSFTLAALGLAEATALKADVNILGGSGKQSQQVHDYMAAAWRYLNAPHQLLSDEPLKMGTRLAWGNSIQALMASQTSVRGPHVQRLRLDEADEMDIKILDAALGQTMSKEGIEAQTTISSTHHNADGTFTEVLRRAQEKGWPVYEWSYLESMEPHGWLPPAEVEAKRGELTEAMWDVEFDLQQPSPESRAIAPDKAAAMFRRELGEFDGALGEYIEIEPPVPGGKYAHGADWARKAHFTVILTLRYDVRPSRVVAFERTGRLPWPQMVARFDSRIRRYGGGAMHDGTGLGDVVDSYLECDAESFMMVGRARADLLSEYIAGIEGGSIEAPLIRFMEGEHKYASVDDVYGGGHLPDSIAAGALTWRAAFGLPRPAPPPAQVQREISIEDYRRAGRASRLDRRRGRTR